MCGVNMLHFQKIDKNSFKSTNTIILEPLNQNFLFGFVSPSCFRSNLSSERADCGCALCR